MIEWQTLTLAGFGAFYVVAGFAVTMWEAKRPKKRSSLAASSSPVSPETALGSAPAGMAVEGGS